MYGLILHVTNTPCHAANTAQNHHSVLLLALWSLACIIFFILSGFFSKRSGFWAGALAGIFVLAAIGAAVLGYGSFFGVSANPCP